MLPALEPGQTQPMAAAIPGTNPVSPNPMLGSALGCPGHPTSVSGEMAKLLPAIGEKGAGQHLGVWAGVPPDLLLLLPKHQLDK